MSEYNDPTCNAGKSADTSTLKLAEGLEPITRELEAIRERSRGSMRFGHSIAKKLGASHVLVATAESCGLRDDLHNAFGKNGDWILADAISLILTPIYDKSALSDLVNNMARELLGITDSFDPSMAPDLLQKVGNDANGINDVLRRRISRAESVMVTDMPFLGEFEESSEDDWIRTMWISTDEHGIPVHYTRGTIGELRELGFDGYQNYIRVLGAEDRVFILEKRVGNADLYERLIERGSRFISVPKSGTPCIRDVASKVASRGASIERDGSLYSVYSTSVAVVSNRIRRDHVDPEQNDNTDTLEIVTNEDPRYSESLPGNRFKLWAYSPLKNNEVDRERMEKRIAVIERRLRKLDPCEAMAQFQETAGSLSRFFHIELRGDELVLEVKRRELDMYLNQTCETMFSYGFDSWQDMMVAFDSRKEFDTTMKVLRGELEITSEFIERTFDSGRSFTLFVAMILWCTVSHKLREANFDVDVDDAMEWLDTMMALGDGLTWKVVGITPRNRKVMGALGVKPPKNTLVTLPYDYKPATDDPDDLA